jgi:hypothetical protein
MEWISRIVVVDRLEIEIEIEIVYNNTIINRLLSLGPPCFAMLGFKMICLMFKNADIDDASRYYHRRFIDI